MNQTEGSLWTKNFLLIICANLFISLGFQMLLPIMPVYAESIGGSASSAGLVVGVFTFSAIIMRPMAGRLLDTYGRKGFYFFGLILFALCVFAYHWTPGILALLCVRFIHGFGWGASSTAASTIATDEIPKARLGEGMGYVSLTSTLSMAIAPIIGLGIMNALGMKAVFNASTVAVLLCIAIAFMIRYQHPSGETSGGKQALLEKAALFPALTIVFVTMSYGAVVSFITLYATECGIDNIGPFFTVYAAALFFSRPFFGRLTDQKGYAITVIPGLAGICAAMAGLFLAKTILGFCLAGFIYGLGFGAVQSALMAKAVRDVPPARRGAANATLFTGFDIGIGAGAILWGVVADITGYQTIYLLAIVPVIAAFLVFLATNKEDLKPSPRIGL